MGKVTIITEGRQGPPGPIGPTGPSGGGSGDHGELTGLADDDHVQYWLSYDSEVINADTQLTGSPRGLVVLGGGHTITFPNLLEHMGRPWSITNATSENLTLNAGTSGALFNSTEQTLQLRPGRSIQVVLVDIGFGAIWGVGSLAPNPSIGGAIGSHDIIAGQNITVAPSEDGQRVTISSTSSSYSPSFPFNWVDPQPTTVNSALDSLSERLHKMVAEGIITPTEDFVITNSIQGGNYIGFVSADTSTQDVTITLPPLSGADGRTIWFHSRNGENNLIIHTTGDTDAFIGSDSSDSIVLGPSQRVGIKATSIAWAQITQIA